MSVVAYKDGILAADSKAYGGDYQPSPGIKMKIHRLSDGSRIGITSAILGMPERYALWLENGANPSEFGEGAPDCCVLMIKPNGDVYLADTGLYFSGPIQCESHAIGSGAKFAIGAMAAGASAAEAVEVACRYDYHCGGPVMTLGKESV